MAWVEAKPKSGGWAVRWRDSQTRKVVTRFFTDEGLARQFKDAVEADPSYWGTTRRKVTAIRADGPTLTEWLRETVEVAELRTGTQEMYESAIRTHIEPSQLGQLPVKRIESSDVDAFFRRLKVGVGAKRNVYQTLSKGFQRALRKGLIVRNPLANSDVRRPSRERREEVEPLTVGEIEALAEAAPTWWAKLGILLAGYAGLRAGEIGGLRLRDIDFPRCHVSVKQAVARTRQHGAAVGPVKTKASRRTISVECSLVEEIARYVEEHPAQRDGRIFALPRGGFVDHIRLNDQVHQAARAAGVREVNFHQLRHTCASLLIHAGANPKQIQVYLGHSSIRTTLDVYGHLFPGADEGLAQTMADLRAEHRAKGAEVVSIGEGR